MNPRFRGEILQTVVDQSNAIFERLVREQPRFKGKCSLVCHSLGSVISYDILRRQDFRNFLNPTWQGAAADVCDKIRRGEDFKPVGAKHEEEKKNNDAFSHAHSGRTSGAGTMWLDSGRVSKDPPGRTGRDPDWNDIKAQFNFNPNNL